MAFITYKQADSRWGSKNYNGSSTMATAGCGPTSVAMLAYAIDGKTNPWIVAQFMQKNNYAIYNNGTAWAGIPAAMKHYGLTSVKSISSMAAVFEEMAHIGRCAVILFRGGTKGGITWTTGGHYIAVTDYKVKDGKHYFYTRDSGNRNHTGWYCYETQMQGLIANVWTGKIPRKDGQYKKDLPVMEIKQGSKNNDVKLMQEFLNWSLKGAFKTLYIDKLTVDGKCNKKTVKAIKMYQTVNHLKVDGVFGAACRKKAKNMKMSVRRKAVNWAYGIALDNDFAYGTGSRAHHNGCYFCGTNITGPKKAKKGSKWEKTYCCNPYIHAAYAHGGGVKSMLTSCKHDSAAGMYPSDWKKHGFKTIGKIKTVKYKNLKLGDVWIIRKTRNHVCMYVGGGYIIEASGGNWSASSISAKKIAKSRFNTWKKDGSAYVMRYKG